MAYRSASPAPTFMTFPQEIRNAIFEECIVQAGSVQPISLFEARGFAIRIDSDTQRQFKQQFSHPAIYMGLLPISTLRLVCRDVNAQIGLIYYAKNTFEFHSVSGALEYLTFIGPERRNAITKMIIHYRDYENSVQLFDLISTCKGLRSLTINISLLLVGHIQTPLDLIDLPRPMHLRGLSEFKFDDCDVEDGLKYNMMYYLGWSLEKDSEYKRRVLDVIRELEKEVAYQVLLPASSEVSHVPSIVSNSDGMCCSATDDRMGKQRQVCEAYSSFEANSVVRQTKLPARASGPLTYNPIEQFQKWQASQDMKW